MTAAVLGGVLGVLPFAGAAAAAAGGDPDVMATVVSLRGDVFAQAPGDEPRRLGCNDFIRRDETVTTTLGSRLAVLGRDVYTTLSDRTEVRFGETRAQTPHLFVAAGRIRVVDARPEGETAAIHLATPHAKALTTGTDTDVTVVIEEIDVRSEFCERGRALRIELEAGEQSVVAEPGQCAEARPSNLRVGARTREPLGVGGDSVCDVIGNVADLFTPADVAAPAVAGFPGPLSVGGLPRQPCDDPGSGCGRIPQPPPPQPPPRRPPPRPPSEPPVVDPGLGFDAPFCPPGASCN
jgi:hypothetical protein